MAAFLAAMQLMVSVDFVAALAKDGISIWQLWAQSGLAAAQRGKPGLLSGSSHCCTRENSTFSAAWPDARTFGCSERSLDYGARNDGTEPNLCIRDFRCERTQHEIFFIYTGYYAAWQQKNRPLVRGAARITWGRIKLRTKLPFNR
jgi:hypothetical protein